MSELTDNRKARLAEHVESYDEKAAKNLLDFTKHRFAAVEHDPVAMTHYLSGYTSLRAACNGLARAVETCDGYEPLFVVDLDSGVKHEVTVTAFVMPTSVNGIGVILPRDVAEAALLCLEDSGTAKQAHTILSRALDAR